MDILPQMLVMIIITNHAQISPPTKTRGRLIAEHQVLTLDTFMRSA